MIVSFRIQPEEAEGATGMHQTRYWPSTIKFGGYDQEDILKGKKLAMTRTHDNSSWDVKMLSWKFGNNKGFPGATELVRFDPGLPYVYLSKSKYKMFAESG